MTWQQAVCVVLYLRRTDLSVCSEAREDEVRTTGRLASGLFSASHESFVGSGGGG